MTHPPHLTIIAGGIGSGKSVVTRLLQVMGYATYDCDARAKWLMSHDPALRQAITELLGPEAYGSNETLNRTYVAERIFGNEALRTALNALVHPAVKADIVGWARQAGSSRCFVETALLHESGLNELTHSVWTVEAPIEVRVKRVMARSNLTEAQVRQRIAAQQTPATGSMIVNDGTRAIIPQVMNLLQADCQ